jgi:hypothetical protein
LRVSSITAATPENNTDRWWSSNHLPVARRQVSASHQLRTLSGVVRRQ